MIEHLMRRYLRDFRARSVLEVGPGYSPFGRVACEVTGARRLVLVDADRAVLGWQEEQCRTAHLACECLLLSLDTDDLGRIAGPFDLILCQEVLEHLPNADAVLATLVTLLGPAGRMVVTVPTRVSEGVMRRLNPSHTEGQVHGHVREFDENALRRLLAAAGLVPRVFLPTQPHYFLSHLWLHATRMQVDMATGAVRTGGWRRAVWGRLTSWSRRFFMLTGPEWWGALLPRNYFVVAERLK